MQFLLNASILQTLAFWQSAVKFKDAFVCFENLNVKCGNLVLALLAEGCSVIR